MIQSLQPSRSSGPLSRVLCADFDRPVSDYQNGPDGFAASLKGQNQQNPRGVTHSLAVLRQGTPLVRSQSQKASSRLTTGVKPKASSAVKNEDKAASLEPRKAFTPKRH